MKRIIAFSLGLVLAVCAQPVQAENDGMISSGSVESLGLTVEWFNTLDVGANGKVVDIQLDVNEDRATTYFTIEYGAARTVVSQHDLDAFGKTMGIDGAEKYVNLRKEIIEQELAASGRELEVKIDKYTLPRSTLYSLTSAGVVTALDADTGQIRWTAEIGSRNLPSIGLGSSHEYVAAVNGSTVYCLEAETGKQLWARKCGGAVAASPAVSQNYVYVPMVDGPLKIFPLFKEGLGSMRFVSVGQSYSRPLITRRTVSWPSDRGHYYVADLQSESQISYRLRTEYPIFGGGSVRQGKLFIGSMDGFIYCIDEFSGALLWEFSTGDHISHAPIALGDNVYVITREGEMFKIDAESGVSAEGWEKPLTGIGSFISATDKNLYLQDEFGSIRVVDRASSKDRGLIRTSTTNLVLENQISNRIYVGNDRGLIQCLREEGSPQPKFHAGDPQPGAAKPGTAKPDDPQQKPGVGQEDDPFKQFGGGDKPGGTDDPFKSGGGDDPFKSGGGDDPFKSGGDDDPFNSGGGGGGANDDPFGGG